MVRLTSRPYLFVDETLIDRHDNTSLRLHSPVRRDVVLVTDAPWEGPDSAYYVVVDTGGSEHTARYLLYYRGAGSADEGVSYACMAESDDGIAWRRRLVWKHSINGSSANNVVWGQERGLSHNLSPFHDTNPAVNPEQRFKAVAGTSEGGIRTLYALVSPDGINWRLLYDTPIITRGRFDSLNIAFWDGGKGCYAAYFRDTRDGVRSTRCAFSDDFHTWSEPEWLDFGPGELEHFYTSAIQPYDRNPGLYLGFPKRFMQDRTRHPECGAAGISDCVLISSRDGIRFPRRFREAFIRPGLDQRNWTHRNIMMAPGMIRTSPTEYSLYWSEHYGHHDNRLMRGTIRVDGFASLHADIPGGEAHTVPVRLDSERLVVNLSTSAVGGLRIEMQDEHGKSISGYSLADADELFGDDIERTVTWKKSPDISRLRGETMRMRIALADADLYSLACH